MNLHLIMAAAEVAEPVPAIVSAIPALLFLGALFFAYILPACIASWRHHHNANAIFVVNLFLGWTLLGWVAALAWAVTNPAPKSLNMKKIITTIIAAAAIATAQADLFRVSFIPSDGKRIRRKRRQTRLCRSRWRRSRPAFPVYRYSKNSV